MTPNGKTAPIDHDGTDDGNVLLLLTRHLSTPIAIVLSGAALELAQKAVKKKNAPPLRLNHWATCPDREEWKEKTA
jgi:hypothetical protein